MVYRGYLDIQDTTIRKKNKKLNGVAFGASWREKVEQELLPFAIIFLNILIYLNHEQVLSC